jgi:hypothetical protein
MNRRGAFSKANRHGARSLGIKTAQAKRVDVVSRLTLSDQIGNYFRDHRTKLEPVPGTRRDNQHLRMDGVTVQKEMFVRRVGVHAGYGVQAGTVQRGDKGRHASSRGGDLGFAYRAVNRIGCATGVFAAVMD